MIEPYCPHPTVQPRGVFPVASIGERLKREREKKKITLDQVSLATKISVRMLRAIEEGKFEQLPGGIFNKAFVRAYARQLAIDEEQAAAEYMASVQVDASVQADDQELRAIAEQREKERQRQAQHLTEIPWGWVAALLLVAAVSLSLWGYYSRQRDGQAQLRTAEAISKQQSETQYPPSVTPPPAARDTNSAQYVPAKSGSNPSDGREVSTAEPHSGAFTVVIKADEDSWLTITADGKPAFSGTLVAPDEKAIPAEKSVTVRAGNVGGVRIFFNGKPLPPQGDYGEVKNLTFGINGLETAISSE